MNDIFILAIWCNQNNSIVHILGCSLSRVVPALVGRLIAIQGTLTYSFQMNSMSDALKSLIILFRVPESQKYIVEAVLTSSI
jgi:hypothetical protein